MAIEDILGFGKASEKLLDILSESCGTLYRPIGIHREASAKAEEIRLLGRAASETEAEKIRIVGLANAEVKLLDSQIDVEILERAKARLAAREIQRQNNIENIAKVALEELPEEVSEEQVDKNWRVRFFNIAEDIADEEMQTLWGRILADEVASPGGYSIRTLETLRNLSKHEAESFQRLRTLTFDGGWIAKLEDTAEPTPLSFLKLPDSNFKEYGVAYSDVLSLRAAGLVASGDSLSNNFQGRTQAGSSSEKKLLTATNNGIVVSFEYSGDLLSIPSVLLTQAGRELMHLIPPSPNVAYLRRVSEGLRSRGVEMYRAKVIDGVIHAEVRDEL